MGLEEIDEGDVVDRDGYDGKATDPPEELAAWSMELEVPGDEVAATVDEGTEEGCEASEFRSIFWIKYQSIKSCRRQE